MFEYNHDIGTLPMRPWWSLEEGMKKLVADQRKDR
jgi:hypothetical protein